MAFRADEAAADRLARTKNYLIPRGFPVEVRNRAEEVLAKIVEQCGPAVDDYPSWHPLVSVHNRRHPHTTPGRFQGYVGLDHTRYFAHGFVTCPYGDGQDVIESVREMDRGMKGPAIVYAEKLDCKFYNEGATPILVRCDWGDPLEENQTVPKRIAVALMMERELPSWRSAEVGETWETMRPYFLGSPHGKRSSLFVTQETALAMKKVYAAMNDAGVFGPLYDQS
ncbi:hypothetical protein [Sphingomonas sanguinis]|uniref:Uncharacterized protein n=1 Tax=Sphingomonas sanguinis TaxID=33051 RepID=A0A147HYX1_9SPHN|nr:hypothetical protein [Sphingomonas sanguinis]KTT70146.1 hypothetical protein NS319_08340 [Sphingomonas sanguinis]